MQLVTSQESSKLGCGLQGNVPVHLKGRTYGLELQLDVVLQVYLERA